MRDYINWSYSLHDDTEGEKQNKKDILLMY